MPVFLRYFVVASQRYARRLEATRGLPVELAVMSAPRQRRSVLARRMKKGGNNRASRLDCCLLLSWNVLESEWYGSASVSPVVHEAEPAAGDG